MSEQEIKTRIALAFGIVFFIMLIVVLFYLHLKREKARRLLAKEIVDLTQKTSKGLTRKQKDTLIMIVGVIAVGALAYFIIKKFRKR